MDYSEKIKQLRKEHNLTQSELAEKLFVTRQAVSLWEQGKVEPSKDTLVLIKDLYGISIDEWLENGAKQVKPSTKDKLKKTILLVGLMIVIIVIIIGMVNLISRANILKPQEFDESIVITKKESIMISQGSPETIVFDESGKPQIKCVVDKSFQRNESKVGLYQGNNGTFIKFNSEYGEDVVNPLLGSDYYDTYENKGYESYMDMMRKALNINLKKTNVFSSKEKLFLAGGSKIIRNHLGINQSADYYEIDGGLTEDFKEKICGFALYFEDDIWLIYLKDYNDNYCYVSIKDPEGIGKSIDTIKAFLSTININ